MNKEKDIHPLTLLWLERIQKGESLRIEDLRPYSKIRLRKKRSRKKFTKKYVTYINERAFQVGIGAISSTPLVNTFGKTFDFKLDQIIEAVNLPKISLQYLDFKYEQNETE